MEVAKLSTCVQATIFPRDVTIYGENKSNDEKPISPACCRRWCDCIDHLAEC